MSIISLLNHYMRSGDVAFKPNMVQDLHILLFMHDCCRDFSHYEKKVRESLCVYNLFT